MHEPCFECLNRRGFGYTKDCDDACEYAHKLKCRDDRIKELESKLREFEEFRKLTERIIDQVVDDRYTTMMLLKELSKHMYSSHNIFGDETLVIRREAFEVIRKKYLDQED